MQNLLKPNLPLLEEIEHGHWTGRGTFEWTWVERENANVTRFDYRGYSMWAHKDGSVEGDVPLHLINHLKLNYPNVTIS